jgi:hypothetical protein
LAAFFFAVTPDFADALGFATTRSDFMFAFIFFFAAFAISNSPFEVVRCRPAPTLTHRHVIAHPVSFA